MLLPPNPYTLRPVGSGSKLAGRASEIQNITYYLSLTAASDSPHIALIGTRGVGKTSLLNATEKIAHDYALLPVRIDLNEAKASTAGTFWYDVYSSLLLAAASAGCWGGVSGPIYAGLFTMLHARQRVSVDLAILQWPLVLASSPALLAEVVCPDALIAHDIATTVTELRRHQLNGIVFIVDEGDCLAHNRSLLQMCRNLFQRLDSCSLILAGTEAVFPALTEVFSPIPRQFHRISVSPFRSWADTEELARDLSASWTPSKDSPSYPLTPRFKSCTRFAVENRLSCNCTANHMYRLVQSGEQKQMSLAPQVFREVARAYRANSPSNLASVLDKVDGLADEAMPPWTRRRRISAIENVTLRILEKELTLKRFLAEDEKRSIATETLAWYKRLQELGITTSADALEFVGGSVTAGYWKSRVDASTGSRWSWDDNHEPFLTHLAVIDRFDDAADSTLAFPVANGRPSGTEALEKLRTNRPTHVDAIGVMGLIAMRSLSQVRSLDHGTIARVVTSYTTSPAIGVIEMTPPDLNVTYIGVRR